MGQHEVVVVGGANLDLKGQTTHELIFGTSNPGTIDTTPGGVGRNIAENLARLGLPVTLLSVVGQDPAGENLILETAGAGVNTDHLLRLKDARTGMYIALLDPDGEMRVALSSMQILDRLTVDYLQSKSAILHKAKYIIADANIPESSLGYLVGLSRERGIPICVEPVSVAKSEKIRRCLQGVNLVTPNRDELASLSGVRADGNFLPRAAEKLIDMGIKTVLVTLGAEGLYCATAQGAFALGSFPAKVANVTGAGDALTAGLVYGLLQSDNLQTACRSGLAAAAVAVSSPDTVSREMSPGRLRRIMEANPNI